MVSVVRVQHEPALIGINAMEHVIPPMIMKLQMRISRWHRSATIFKAKQAGLVKTLWGSTLRIRGERGRTRTCDPCLKRALLYQLSYAPALSQYYCIKWKAVAPAP